MDPNEYYGSCYKNTQNKGPRCIETTIFWRGFLDNLRSEAEAPDGSSYTPKKPQLSEAGSQESRLCPQLGFSVTPGTKHILFGIRMVI